MTRGLGYLDAVAAMNMHAANHSHEIQKEWDSMELTRPNTSRVEVPGAATYRG